VNFVTKAQSKNTFHSSIVLTEERNFYKTAAEAKDQY